MRKRQIQTYTVILLDGTIMLYADTDKRHVKNRARLDWHNNIVDVVRGEINKGDMYLAIAEFCEWFDDCAELFADLRNHEPVVELVQALKKSIGR